MHKDIQFKLHFQEELSQTETLLTNELARSLTDLNLKRVQQATTLGLTKIKGSLSDRKDYLYVCITGMPAFKHQFEEIGLPGEKIVVYPACFEPGLTEEQSKSQIPQAQLQTQAALLHERISNRKDKPMVFVIHSFGTAIMSTFFRIYYTEYLSRVIGIIGIGAYPIRVDHNFVNYVLWTQSLTKEEIFQHADTFYARQNELLKLNNILPSPNKYAYIGLLISFGHGLGFDELFSYIRRWFPVLKCFIYGRQDNRLREENLNQTAIYYCHKRKVDSQTEAKVQNFFKERYRMKVDNVQERFIYNIDGGKHSIHMQKRFKPLISEIVNEYLSALEDSVTFKP